MPVIIKHVYLPVKCFDDQGFPLIFPAVIGTTGYRSEDEAHEFLNGYSQVAMIPRSQFGVMPLTVEG